MGRLTTASHKILFLTSRIARTMSPGPGRPLAVGKSRPAMACISSARTLASGNSSGLSVTMRLCGLSSSTP